MDIGNILNNKGNAAAAAAEAQRQQQLAHATSNWTPQPRSALDSQQGSNPDQPQPLHPSTNPPNKYPSSTLGPRNIQMMSSGFPADGLQENGYPDGYDGEASMPTGEHNLKSFACKDCLKSFTRRSDLSRHGRIHSGVRPHVCQWPGCDKQFIQRSALTVHVRVHTGEKPHMCDRCGKRFGDSSSLARHRRIHSGKRPYKCPYANCQKTFTRRTTLTRHQNHHIGTIEEAAAETTAKLTSTEPPLIRPTEGVSFSDTVSSHSTPTSSQGPATVSPNIELPPIPSIPPRPSELGYLQPNGSFPPHLRADFQHASPRSSPGLASPSLAGSLHNNHLPPHRPSLTSHPTGYGPPQPLEPPANTDHRSVNSVGGSPHLSGIGWGSPSNPNMPSPSAIEAYAYPDPGFGGGPLYYPGSNIRRPQSTEPDQFETKPRMHPTNLAGNLPEGADWSGMPISMQQMHHLD